MDHRVRREEVKVGASTLAGYAAAASAAAIAGSAHGAITYSGPLNIPLVDTTTDGLPVEHDLTFGSTPYHLDLIHGVGTANAATGYAVVQPTGLGSPGVDVAGFVSGYNYVTNVAANALISTLTFLTITGSNVGTMAFNAGYSNSQFLTAGDAFIGVRFNTNQYGWVRVNMSGSTLNSFSIVDYAYGDAGEQIRAGQTQSVPAPGSLAALAMGAAGLKDWRKRRKTA